MQNEYHTYRMYNKGTHFIVHGKIAILSLYMWTFELMGVYCCLYKNDLNILKERYVQDSFFNLWDSRITE